MAKAVNSFALLGDEEGDDMTTLLDHIAKKVEASLTPLPDSKNQKVDGTTAGVRFSSKSVPSGHSERAEERRRGGPGRGFGRRGSVANDAEQFSNGRENGYQRNYNGDSNKSGFDGASRGRGRGRGGNRGRGRGHGQERGFYDENRLQVEKEANGGDENQVENAGDAGWEEVLQFHSKGYVHGEQDGGDEKRTGYQNYVAERKDGYQNYGGERKAGYKNYSGERRDGYRNFGDERRDGYQNNVADKREGLQNYGVEKVDGYRKDGGERRGGYRNYGGERRGFRGSRDGINSRVADQSDNSEVKRTVNGRDEEAGNEKRNGDSDQDTAVVPHEVPIDIESEEKKPEEVTVTTDTYNSLKKDEETYNSLKKDEEKEEDNFMTLEEYEKLLSERRKALGALKIEERKVTLDRDFEAMQLVERKKEEIAFIKLKSEKEKFKKKDNSPDKEEKVARKSVSINEFLKPAEGEEYVFRRGGRSDGSGRFRGDVGGPAFRSGGRGGGRGHEEGEELVSQRRGGSSRRGRGDRNGFRNGYARDSAYRGDGMGEDAVNISIEDPGQFPVLGSAATVKA
ncbi:hypothetical protein Nepgr_032807 [Nepenthes gracilis]|uniref:Hyaluronan/mRNA-binding protein domain-containing protein n=1 Tax=Nepenthes gracilis TaxID=150966 RepID=A0AAD3TKS9_NEPGR|nr:hypothetical protein Nepgr_032807 [Nepenthes gracilis]